MRVKLGGINTVRVKLADGTTATYHYLGKGGPRLRGKLGSPEFVASYNEAAARKLTPPTGVLNSILQRFQASTAFTDLAPRTRIDYGKKLRLIERDFGDFPLAALTDKKSRAVFKEWRDRMAASSRRQADYAWVVLARVLSWALEDELVDANPCARGGRLYHGTRAEKIWSDEEEAAFNAVASAELRLALLLAIYTGQRQGDLLTLKRFAYDGTHIRLRQSKGGVRVKVKVHSTPKAELDALQRDAEDFILLNSHREPWTADGFRSSWAKACRKAGIVGVTFHDLRGTAVTRLALVGCTEAEIADITGHALGSVRAILDTHYLCRDGSLGDKASRSSKREQFSQTHSQMVKMFYR